MKKWLSLLLSLLLLAGLAACGSQAGGEDATRGPSETPVETTGEATEEPSDAAPSQSPITINRGGKKKDEPAAKEVSVSEMIDEEGTATDSYGTEFAYSFHVPQIDDDTEVAEIINEEIAENFGPIVGEALDDIADGQIPGYCDISYEDYRSGGILSLVVKLSYYYEPSVDYVTYCYDMERGVMLHNAGVLKALGVTEEAYLHALGRAAAKYYDGAYFSAFDTDGAALDGSPYDYQKQRIWTLSERNLSLDLPLYLDDRGIVHVLTPIGSHAGPDYLHEDLVLDLEEDAGRPKSARLGDYLTATLRDNIVTLRIERTDQLEGMADLIDPALFGTDLEVHGLYGSYSRIFCAGMGMADAPYVFLLTEEGRVECIDVLECLTSGYFCGCGPILGAEDVVDFELATDELDLSLVYAVTGSGERVDLRDLADFQRYTLPEDYCGEDWTRCPDGSDVICYLKLRDGNGENFSYDIVDAETGGAYTSCDGTLAYLGMTEQGAVYGYYAFQRYTDEPGEYGAVALERRDEYDGDGWESVLYVTELTGENAGNVMEFSQAVG